MSLLNHAFVASTGAPLGLVSGDFYDFKRYLKSIVNINLQNTAQVVTHYSIQINNTATPVNVITLLSNGETSTKKRAEVEIIHSAAPSPTLKDGNIEYAFTDGNTYCIKHLIVVKEIVNGATETYNYTHHQNFRYYATPVTLSDFSFGDNIQSGDTLKITGLALENTGYYNPADSTYPENTTIANIINYPMRFTIREVSSDSCANVEYAHYELPYASNGDYDLSNIQLTPGKYYNVSVEASWLLGYSTSIVSTKTLSILNRPVITKVEIADLYLYDSNADVVTITIDQIISPINNVVTKIWFEFYNSNNDLRARAGDATNGFAVTSINNTQNTSKISANNVYPLKLSDISYGSLNNTEYYKVKAKVQYTDGKYRTSNPFPTATADYKNFTNTIPVIVSNTINPLYTIDDPSNGKILDIVVKNEAYQLIAPNATSGIKFHFYDGVTLVASTSSYTFVNSLGGNNHSYPILLSEVTPNVLVNDKDYRIKAEVMFTGILPRFSVLSAESSLRDKVKFSLKYPSISNIIPYDFQNDGNIDDSGSQVIASIVVPRQSYELVAPTSTHTATTGGIRFLIYKLDGTTLFATTKYYDFVNNSTTETNTYPIKLHELTLEDTKKPLENNYKYRVRVEVAIIKHSQEPELRPSVDLYNYLEGTQNVVPLTSVTISNSWALATDNNPSLLPALFNDSPPIGISGYFKKTLQFNPLVYKTRNLDVITTKFKIEYKVGDGGWTNVKRGVLSQKKAGESLAEAVGRVNAITPIVSVAETNGKFDNVPTTDPTNNDYQEEMIFFIPQQQVEESNAFAFTESNNVQVQITIDDSVNIWGSTGDGSVSAATSSNLLQLIKKINTYNYAAGQSSEPWNSTSNGNLFLNIPVDWDSIHAHSVKVGVKYSSSNLVDYSYQIFAAPTSEVQISVDPNQGTTLYYSVAYIVNNVNLVSTTTTTTTEGLTTEKIVSNKFFPSSSDYSVTNTSYKTFNTGGKSSITFDLSFNAISTSTSVIHGVNVYFTSTDSSITKTRIGTYTAFQSGTGKTIQLLYTDDTKNYAGALDNKTALMYMADSPESMQTSLSKFWGDFDSASISFEAYRDSRVVSTTASYGTTYYVESGSSDFDKTIWNVPVLRSPSDVGSITLVGGVRNSSTATKLSWPHVSNLNGGTLTYDLTMKKNAESSFIHNNVDSDALDANEKTLTIEGANAKYTITLESVFAPTGATMREKSAVDTIEFHTIYVDVSNINISVQNPSTTSKVNLSFSDAVVSGDSVTGSASFVNNIDEQHVVYSTTNTANPTNALTRLAQEGDSPIERLVSPATKKEYTLPVQTLATLYSFFMKLKAHIDYKVNTTISQTPAVEISTQTTQTDLSQYKVSSIPIIGSSFTTTIDTNDNRPVLKFSLDANGLEDEGFISVVVIIGQDGTPDKVEGESVILVFPDTGAVEDYSNVLAGSGSASLDPRLAGGESYTSNPRSLTGAVMGTHDSPSPSYTLTIGDVTPTPYGRYANSTLKMPTSSLSGFTDGPINMWVLATTRRGTDFSALVATYSPLVAVSNLSVTGSGDDFHVNFNLNPS
jgi:hypothetical protein